MSWRGKVSKNVHQLIFYFCPKNTQSNGVREFIVKNYSEIKALNPSTGLLVRETPEVDPFIMVERHFGAREKKDVKDFTKEDIEKLIKEISLEENVFNKETRPLHERIVDVADEEYLRFNPEIPFVL
ncbi:hypothetical protein ABK040_011605 [Willaertia magna]